MAIAFGTVLMAHQVMSRGTALYRGPLRRFLMCLCPPLLVGAGTDLAAVAAWRNHADPGRVAAAVRAAP